MADVQVTVIGHVGAELPSNNTQAGLLWTSFSVASTRRYLVQGTGEWRDGPTMWFRVKAFNDRARNAVKSLKKGTPVIVQGRLAQREYEVSRQSTDSEGQPITVMEKRMDLEIENATIAVDLTRGSAPYTREYWNTQAPEGAPAVACASGPTGGLNRYGEQEIVGQSFGSSAQPDIETDAGETGDPEVEQIAA